MSYFSPRRCYNVWLCPDVKRTGKMAEGQKQEQNNLIYNDEVTDSEKMATSHGINSLEMVTSTASQNIKWKRAYSLFLCLAFFIFGWVSEQIGPAILDLQDNTGVSFTLASMYLMSINFGHIFGSLGGGVLYDKINTYILLFMSVSGVAVAVAVIPWCFSFPPMLIAHIIQGVFGGCLDSVVLAEIMAVWGYEVESPMQVLYFSFALGAIISPICVTPFLKDAEVEDNFKEASTHFPLNSTLYSSSVHGKVINNFTETSTHFPLNSTLYSSSVHGKVINNFTETSTHFPFNSTMYSSSIHGNVSSTVHKSATEQSLLYIPYSISAGLSFLAALPFFFVFLKSVIRDFKIPYVQEDARYSKSMSLVFRFTVLAVTGTISAFDTAVEEAASDFLTAFCVLQMHWTKQNGAFATSVLDGSFAFGRLVGIVEAIYIKPEKLLIFHTLLLVTACIAFMLSAHFMFNAGIWICSSLIGIAMSVVSPSIFSLTEDNFFPVTGKISSFFVITACIGSGVNSFFVGYLMDTFSPLSLVYVLLSEGILIFLLVLAVLYLIYKVEETNAPKKS